MFAVCGMLFIVRRLFSCVVFGLLVVCYRSVGCLLFVVCCVLFAVC